MVHTAMFMILLTSNDLNAFMEHHSIREIENDIEINDIKLNENEAIRLNIRKGLMMKYNTNRNIADYGEVWRGFLLVDFIELLGKVDIFETDFAEAIIKIEDYLCKYVKSDNILELIRIDYRYDAYLPDKKERAMLLKMYRKCSDKTNYMKKEIKNEWKTSIVYRSKSRKDNIYDKQAQMSNVGREPKEYEKGVLRFEAQIMPRHTYYQLRSNKIERSLMSYFSEFMFRKYMDKMIVRTIYRGNYYNEYHVKKLLRKSKIFKELEKKEALEFMILISKLRNVTKAIEIFGKYKADKYIKKLQAENINPILIPKSERVTQMENPLRELYDTWEK